MVDSVGSEMRLRVPVTNALVERLRRRKDTVYPLAKPALEPGDLGRVNPGNLRPFVNAVVDRQRFAKGTYVVRGGWQERPELELVDSHASSEPGDRLQQNLPVQQGREPTVRQRQNRRRIGPEPLVDRDWVPGKAG